MCWLACGLLMGWLVLGLMLGLLICSLLRLLFGLVIVVISSCFDWTRNSNATVALGSAHGCFLRTLPDTGMGFVTLAALMSVRAAASEPPICAPGKSFIAP